MVSPLVNATLLRSLVAFVVVGIVVAASALSYRRRRDTGSVLQLLGSGFLVVVVVVHVFESLGVFPQMQWGQPRSVGHYLDLGSAILGLTLFPLGFVLTRLRTTVRNA